MKKIFIIFILFFSFINFSFTNDDEKICSKKSKTIEPLYWKEIIFKRENIDNDFLWYKNWDIKHIYKDSWKFCLYWDTLKFFKIPDENENENKFIFTNYIWEEILEENSEIIDLYSFRIKNKLYHLKFWKYWEKLNYYILKKDLSDFWELKNWDVKIFKKDSDFIKIKNKTFYNWEEIDYDFENLTYRQDPIYSTIIYTKDNIFIDWKNFNLKFNYEKINFLNKNIFYDDNNIYINWITNKIDFDYKTLEIKERLNNENFLLLKDKFNIYKIDFSKNSIEKMNILNYFFLIISDNFYDYLLSFIILFFISIYYFILTGINLSIKKKIIYSIWISLWILLSIISNFFNLPIYIIYLIIIYFTSLFIWKLFSFIFEINIIIINFFIIFFLLFIILFTILDKDFWIIFLIWYFTFYIPILFLLIFMAVIKWNNKIKKENKEDKKDLE